MIAEERHPAPTEKPSVLEIQNLGIRIRGVQVVDNVNLSIRPGEALALVGESGCGKSLTSLAVMGLQPDAAELVPGTRILLHGRDIAGLDDAARNLLRGKDMGMIFQEPLTSLNPLMPVGPQVMESLLTHGVPHAQARDRALSMLQKVGIADSVARFNQFPFELSGGMCQRVMIALALVANPGLLIADEPTTALDVTIQAQILDLMRGLMRESDTALLLITHDMGVVAELADRVAVMYAGRIVELADVFDLFAQQRHPYTKLLLASLPRLNAPVKTLLNTISGTVPDIRDWKVGCRFHPRCPLAQERCKEETPPLTLQPKPWNSGSPRWAACWYDDQTERL